MGWSRIWSRITVKRDTGSGCLRPSLPQKEKEAEVGEGQEARSHLSLERLQLEAATLEWVRYRPRSLQQAASSP